MAEAATDAKGEFTVEAKAGQYVIVIEPLGYDVIEKQINLESALDLGTFTVKTFYSEDPKEMSKHLEEKKKELL